MNTDLKRDPLVAVLETHPSAGVIEQTLAPFSAPGVIPSLPLVTAVLNHTVPEAYKSVSTSTKRAIVAALQNLVGIGSLLARLTPDSPQNMLTLYTDVVIDVFDNTLVTQIVTDTPGKLQLKELDKLVFKGRAFGVVAQALAQYGSRQPGSAGVFESSHSYTVYASEAILELHRQNADIHTINTFVGSIRSFSPENPVFFDVFFSRANWPYLVRSVKAMKSFERKEFVTQFLTRFMSRWLLQRPNGEVLGAVARLVEFAYECFDARVAEKIVACSNFGLNNVVAQVLARVEEPKLYKIAVELLGNWADESLIKSEPLARQQSRTHLLIHVFCYKKGSTILSRLSTDPVLLNGVSSRLSALSNSSKGLAIILSNTLSEMCGNEPIFKDLHNYGQDINQVKVEIVPPLQTDSDPWDIIESPQVHQPEPEIQGLQIQTSELAPYADSDDESGDDEDPSVTSRAQIPDPLYIKDLLAYLTVDSKHGGAYEMTKSALRLGPTLVRQKADFGNELAMYADELVSNIVGLSDQYSIPQFETLRLNLLIAVVVSHPDVTPHLLHLLLTGDYSLQTRMVMLSAVSLSVRELRGYSDKPVTQSYTTVDFASKTLPASAHNLFSQPLPEHEAIASVQDGLMAESSEKARSNIDGGTVLRVSRALRPRSREQTIRPKRNHFYKLVSSHFFYPLIRVWYETGEFDIGTFTPVFVGHYLATLNLVLHSAYPSAPNLHDMVAEYIVLLNPLIARVQSDQLPIVESLVTGVLLICDIMDGQFLVARHSPFIQLVQTWLQQTWEDVIDERIKSLCAGLLLRLSELTETYQRTLLDQLNSVY